MERDRLKMRVRTLVGGLVLVAPVLLVGQATGASDRGVFKRVEVVAIDGAQGTKGRGVARCPKGTRAISGGWAMSDPEETGLLVTESRRVGKRGWAVAAIQATNNSFLTDLLPTAYCERGARRTRAVSATGSVPSGETGSVDATCPKKRKAVAGGFRVPTSAGFGSGGLPVGSQRVGRRTWRVVVYAPAPAGATVTAYADCARRPGKLRSRARSKPTRELGRHVRVLSGKCAKRIGVRAGGFAIGDRTSPQFSIPIFVREGRRWEVWARNFGGPSTRLRAVAYCH